DLIATASSQQLRLRWFVHQCPLMLVSHLHRALLSASSGGRLCFGSQAADESGDAAIAAAPFRSLAIPHLKSAPTLRRMRHHITGQVFIAQPAAEAAATERAPTVAAVPLPQ